MIDRLERLINLLDQLETTMKSASLWAVDGPPDNALESEQPFACDLLRFEQWLQFIFLPRARVMCTKSSVNLGAMILLPMAHMSWGKEHRDVQSVITQLDSWSTSTIE